MEYGFHSITRNATPASPSSASFIRRSPRVASSCETAGACGCWSSRAERAAGGSTTGDPSSRRATRISFGPFPEITLAEARAKCDAARILVAQGIDPAQHRQEVQRAAFVSADAALFQKIADDYFDEAVSNQDPETQRRVKIEMNELTRTFSQRAIESIEPVELGEMLKAIYRSGRQSKARRVRALASRIFRYAISEGRCKYDIAATFQGRFKSRSKKRAAITDQLEVIGLERTEQLVGKLMRDIHGYRGVTATVGALEMMALTFPRPANVLKMEWSEIDFATNVWIIPAAKMKMDRVHKVPLPRQALAILERIRPLTGKSDACSRTSAARRSVKMR